MAIEKQIQTNDKVIHPNAYFNIQSVEVSKVGSVYTYNVRMQAWHDSTAKSQGGRIIAIKPITISNPEILDSQDLWSLLYPLILADDFFEGAISV